MPTYKVTAPDGKVLRITGDAPPTEAELNEIFKTHTSAPAAAPSPIEQPSTGGFISNAADSAVNVLGGMASGAAKVLTQSPVQSMFDIADGVKNRVKQYASDMHPVDAMGKLTKGDVTGAIGTALPTHVMYQDPVGVGADIAAGSGILKGFKGIGSAAGGAMDAGAKFQADSVSKWVQDSPHTFENGKPAIRPIGEKPRIRSAPLEPVSPAEEMFRSTDDNRDWHSGAEPGSDEARQASSLHRETADLDAGFSRQMSDPRGFVTPDALFGLLSGMLKRQALKQMPSMLPAAKAVAGPALRGANISRFADNGQ